MPIVPLPVFEAEADPKTRGLTEEEIAQYSALKPPESVVVRYGYMKWIGEFPCRIDVKPGCGTRFVARTVRGTELVEMLTSCSNGGCGHSLTRREMLDYIDKSGGKDYPFTTKGKILRIATTEDMARQSALDGTKKDIRNRAKAAAADLNLPMKIVEVEPILGEEVLTVYYTSEDRIDFRDLVKALAADYKTRIEMRQVGARDEARITADYERCGQHCCCQHFLKVLKPISMKNAKIQKATLDPLKISGRCGRLMCCLRYEEATYDDLRKRLPHKKTRVNTPSGIGIVLETQIITQLVMVQLESDGSRIAVPVENITKAEPLPRGAAAIRRPDAQSAQAPVADGDAAGPQEPGADSAISETSDDPLRGMSPEDVRRKLDVEAGAQPSSRMPAQRPDQPRGNRPSGPRPPRTGDERQSDFRNRSRNPQQHPGQARGPRDPNRSPQSRQPQHPPLPPNHHPAPARIIGPTLSPSNPIPPSSPPGGSGSSSHSPGNFDPSQNQPQNPDNPSDPLDLAGPGSGRERRRRRRRRRGGGGGGGGGGGSGGGSGGGQPPSAPA